MPPNVQYPGSLKSKKKGDRQIGEKFSQNRRPEHFGSYKGSYRSRKRNDRRPGLSRNVIQDHMFWASPPNGPVGYDDEYLPSPADYYDPNLMTPDAEMNLMLTGQQQYAGANHYMNAPGYNAPNPYGYNMGPQPPIPGYQGQPQASVFHSPQQQFNPTTSTFQPAGSQSMSRQGSAISHTERPGSSGPPPPAPPGNGPVIASGSHPGSVVQSKAAIVSGTTTGSSAFSRPKKSTIVIKTAQGEEVDFKKGFGAGSPVPLTASKTPPAKTPSPAPGVKPAEPPAEPTATIVKTTEERKKEFAEAVAKAKAETEAKAKEEAEAQAAAETKAKAEEQARIEAEAKAKKEAEAKAKKEAEARAKAEEEVKAKVEAEKKTQQEADMAAKAIEAQSSANPPSKLTLEELEAKGMDNMTPEEQELYFDLLDAQDAAREAEQEEITNRKKAEEAEAKVKADAERVRNAADEDRKLREAEAEAERLELEKEQRQKEREARGESMDIKTALTATIADLRAVPDKKESFTEPANSVGSVTNKMAGLSLNKNAALGAKSGSQRQKPAALNLQPLKTSAVEAPQPSAALQSLKSARFLAVMTQDIYPEGIKSPNPAVNAAARGKTAPFRYDLNFMLQFQGACKEAPSMDFQQQVKTLIGEEPGSRSASTKNAPGMSRQPSRAGGSSYTAMGSFGASGPMDRAMPGMGSGASRFGLQGNPPMGGRPQPNPMGSFPRGSFPGGTGMSRNSSNTGMIPNSPRTGSHRGGGSKRNNPHATVKQREKENVAMPLTQGMDIGKLTTSSSGWKPQSLSKKGVSGESGLMDPETVQRKVKAALNKMTPEKFDRLSDQILEIASQSKHEKDGRTLRQVIQLVFEKATDEAHWSGMYAKFCRRMLDTMDPEIRDEGILDKNSKVVFGGALFRKYLLNRCQEDFERGWAVNLPPPKEGESKEAVLLSDEYYAVAAVKRRGLGLVQFIGELFKLNMLTERIMHACIRKLLDYEGDPDEAEIESLCKLLKTVGQPLDESEKSHAVMNAYFQRINSMIETENLPSRMKFMLMDVVDLRKAGWESSADNKGPKTLEEVRADQERARAQKEAEAVRSQRQSGRAPGGRDNRNFSQGFGQSAPNQIGLDDLRRLKGSANRSSSHNITLGPGSSMLGSRSNSGRKVGGPGGSLGRSNDDGSRTGTPIQRQSTSNQFALLAAHEDTASPPSTAASPNLPKAIPASSDAKKAD